MIDARSLLWLSLAALGASLLVAVGGADYSDLRGPYCATRGTRGTCCPNRQDDCSVPILGTLCYCDDFCNRTNSEDCCPDYWSFCKGIIPPPEPVRECYHNGRYYVYGETVKINCNECKCQSMGGRLELLCEQSQCLVDPEIIQGVNADTYRLGWRASNHTPFWGHRLTEGISLRLGTLQPQRAVMRMRPVKRVLDPSRLPRSFDARSKWPGMLSSVRDQGWCGASWAISTADVASDRFHIMSKGTEPVTLSAGHLLECNSRGQRGCQGGNLDRAWLFMRKFGVVDEPCYPYTAQSGTPGKCRLGRRANLLTARCTPPRTLYGPPRTELYRTGPAYRLGSEEDIMHEIMESGPVQATMKVYHDFFMYRGGIYRHSMLDTTQRTGYHSVRIVGWGEAQGTKYWIVANSWGDQWGENGYFRIRRGTNECEIENFVVAAWADTQTPVMDNMMSNHDNRLSNVVY
ncbi:tubulointerstitial nephritis antigen-like [Schistocerca cancellata]|uniref:tubulointerstitial nephritis antigen-like n=1 Tax=Schistocerca cancellata TaxID=274614 RepID=UPI002117C67E|nr:tubulointerstitial nephritis antigen-like [Schistocerca cancellata]